MVSTRTGPKAASKAPDKPRDRKPKKPVKPLRFLDLPPELRNRVYDLLIPETRVVTTQLQLHPLTRVSRQVRKETLDITCARTTLIVHAHAVFFMPGVADGPWQAGGNQDKIFALWQFEAVFGDLLRFRQVQWRLHDRYMKWRPRLWDANKRHREPMLPRDFMVFGLTMSLSEEGELSFLDAELYKLRGSTVPKLGGVEDVMEVIMSNSMAIAERKDFKGFTPRDLGRVVMGL